MKVIRDASTPMESLAQEIEYAAAAEQPQDPEAEQASEQEAQALRQLDVGMAKLTMGLFKVLRAVLSRQLPELRDEWTDSVLQAPADALVPVLKKYLASLMERLAENPELAVFAMTILPLVMGYMDALARHEKTVTDAVGRGLGAAAQASSDGSIGAG